MNDSYTRRHFIQAAGAGLAALAGARRPFSATAAAQGAIDPRDADLVVVNVDRNGRGEAGRDYVRGVVAVAVPPIADFGMC